MDSNGEQWVGQGIANTIHIATLTLDRSLGFSSLKVRTNKKKKEKKCTQESKIGPKQIHKQNQFMVRLQAEILSNTTLRKGS